MVRLLGQKHGLRRVAEDDPDSDLYAESRLAADHAIDSLDCDHVTVNDVHDAVLADAQPVVPAPVKRLGRVRVISQVGDGCADGAHAFLVSQVTAR